MVGEKLLIYHYLFTGFGALLLSVIVWIVFYQIGNSVKNKTEKLIFCIFMVAAIFYLLVSAITINNWEMRIFLISFSLAMVHVLRKLLMVNKGSQSK